MYSIHSLGNDLIFTSYRTIGKMTCHEKIVGNMTFAIFLFLSQHQKFLLDEIKLKTLSRLTPFMQ